MLNKLTNLLSRIFGVVAAILFAIATIDWVLERFGWTITGLYYKPGRLFEFSAIMMVFVIAFVLRQIRESLRK